MAILPHLRYWIFLEAGPSGDCSAVSAHIPFVAGDARFSPGVVELADMT
jgi:hypothetical protein